MKVGLILFAVSVLATTRANAQDEPASLVRAGVAHRRAGDEAGALPFFERAYAAAPSAANAALLGLSEEALEHYGDAEHHLRDALAASDDAWIVRNRETLEAAYAIARARNPVAVAAGPRTPSPARATAAAGTRPAARPSPPGATLGAVALATGGGLAVGGAAAWVAREIVVDRFNAQGCRVGDPAPTPGCNAADTQHARDAATVLAVVGLSAGVATAALGLVVLLAPHARADDRQRVRLACEPEFTTRSLTCGAAF